MNILYKIPLILLTLSTNGQSYIQMNKHFDKIITWRNYHFNDFCKAFSKHNNFYNKKIFDLNNIKRKPENLTIIYKNYPKILPHNKSIENNTVVLRNICEILNNSSSIVGIAPQTDDIIIRNFREILNSDEIDKNKKKNNFSNIFATYRKHIKPFLYNLFIFLGNLYFVMLFVVSILYLLRSDLFLFILHNLTNKTILRKPL